MGADLPLVVKLRAGLRPFDSERAGAALVPG